MRQTSYSRKNINLKNYMGLVTNIDENLLPLNASPLSYNFVFERGVLSGNLGVDGAKMSSITSSNMKHNLAKMPDGKKVKSIHLYQKYDFTNNKRDDKVIVRANDNSYYETSIYKNDTFHLITNLSSAGKDCSVCYRYNGNDLFLLSSEIEGLYSYDGVNVTHIQNAPQITSMCVHSERVFATTVGEQNKVWFSSLFNPNDWNVSGEGAGFIEFQGDGGKVIKVVKFLNYVYVFRDFGIERITAFGNQNDFSVTRLYMSSAKIFEDTISCMGDKIIFMADNGLFVFNGYDVKNICPQITLMLPRDKNSSLACGLNGKYFLATALDFGDDNANPIIDEAMLGHINNSIVVYDCESDNLSIMRGIDCCCLTPIKIHTESSVLVAPNILDKADTIGQITKSGKYFNEPLKKYWSTGYTDLGYPDKKKTIRSITICTSCNIILGVEIDGNTTEYEVSRSELPQKIVVNKMGSKLRVFLYTNVGKVSSISAPTVLVDIV